jgi:hypothetical protein
MYILMDTQPPYAGVGMSHVSDVYIEDNSKKALSKKSQSSIQRSLESSTFSPLTGSLQIAQDCPISAFQHVQLFFEPTLG